MTYLDYGRGALLDETVVSSASATAVLGDLSGDPLEETWNKVFIELFAVRPTAFGVLEMRYGAGGSWHSGANYRYAVDLTGSRLATTGVALKSSFSGHNQVQYELQHNTYPQRVGLGNQCTTDITVAFHPGTPRAVYQGKVNYTETANLRVCTCDVVGKLTSDLDVSAFEFAYGGTTIAAGVFRLYGLSAA